MYITDNLEGSDCLLRCGPWQLKEEEGLSSERNAVPPSSLAEDIAIGKFFMPLPVHYRGTESINCEFFLA